MVCKDEKLVNDVTGCFDWVGGLISLRNPKINKGQERKKMKKIWVGKPPFSTI